MQYKGFGFSKFSSQIKPCKDNFISNFALFLENKKEVAPIDNLSKIQIKPIALTNLYIEVVSIYIPKLTVLPNIFAQHPILNA